MPWWNYHYSPGWYPFERSILFPLLVPAVIWSLIWKGIALYRSARNEQKGWFVALLLLNTLGILEIVYLLFFSNIKKTKSK